jgi:hypothetical protein
MYRCDPVCVGVDYNLTLCPLQSRLQHIYHGQPYASVDDLNPMPESTLFDLCTHWVRPANPHPPHLGSYTRALLVSQDGHDISL